MVESPEKNVFFLRQLEQLDPQQRAVCQIKRLGPFIVHGGGYLSLLLVRRKAAETVNWDFQSKDGRNDLHRHSLLFSKMRAQAFMPIDDGLDGATQRTHIQS